MNAYAVVYRNEGAVATESERKAVDDLRKIVSRWDEQPFAAIAYDTNKERRIIRECLRLASKLLAKTPDQPYTLHTLCKTPECAVESISPFEGTEVFGMATIAVESEPVSGLRYRVDYGKREKGDAHGKTVAWAYRSEDPYDAGQWMTTGLGAAKPDRREVRPLIYGDTTLREAAAAGIEGYHKRMRGTNPGSNE